MKNLFIYKEVCCITKSEHAQFRALYRLLGKKQINSHFTSVFICSVLIFKTAFFHQLLFSLNYLSITTSTLMFVLILFCFWIVQVRVHVHSSVFVSCISLYIHLKSSALLQVILIICSICCTITTLSQVVWGRVEHLQTCFTRHSLYAYPKSGA